MTLLPQRHPVRVSGTEVRMGQTRGQGVEKTTVLRSNFELVSGERREDCGVG